MRTIQVIEARLMHKPGFQNLYDERYEAPRVTLASLQTLPLDSFGHALYKHLHDNNLDWDLFPKIVATRPIEYLAQKIYADHDLWHTLLDYGSSVEDELALQAFGVAQYGSPLGCVLIAGGLLHLLRKDPSRAVTALEKISEGYRRGHQVPFLLGLKIYEMLDHPLDEVRRELRMY